MRYITFLTFLSLVLFCSCRSETSVSLDQVESLVFERPDSALSVLNSLSRKDLNNLKESARFALLKSIAFDKNYIDVSSDSLTREAVDYYTAHGDKEYRMLSWYYHALVQINKYSYGAAIVALEEAEKIAHQLNDSFQMGLILRAKAQVFKFSNNIPAAIECTRKAIDHFDLAGKENYKAYAELALAIDYINNKDYEKADSLLTYIRQYYHNLNLDNHCNIHQAGIMAEMDKTPHIAIELYTKTPQKYFNLLDYGYLASSYEAIGERDSSDYWLSKGYSLCKDQADSASLDYLKSKIELQRGHYHEAYFLVDRASSVQDSLTRIFLTQSVSAAQRDFYRSESLRQEEVNQTLRLTVFLGVVVTLLILTSLFWMVITWSKKKDLLLQQQVTRLALQERELERISKDNAHLLGSLFSDKIDHLDRLSESYVKMEDGKQKEFVFKQIKKLVSTIRSDDGLFLSLEKDLDRYCNGIMSKLREQVPRINGENLKLISLFFAGYSYEIVQMILNKVSIPSLKTARSRFRKEISEANAPDAAFFLMMLEMKKRPQVGAKENMGVC